MYRTKDFFFLRLDFFLKTEIIVDIETKGLKLFCVPVGVVLSVLSEVRALPRA